MPRSKKKTDGPIVRSPSCPRCGYDLTGVVESWTERCPVDGVCSECGYAFLWKDLLLRSNQSLYWLYEHKRGIAFKSLCKTALETLRPKRFWSCVCLHHDLNPHRSNIFPIALFGLIYLASTVIAAVIFGARYAIFGQATGITTYTWQSEVMFLLNSQFNQEWHWLDFGFSEYYYVAMPIVFFCFSVLQSVGFAIASWISHSSRNRTGVRTDHLMRSLAYSITAPLLVYVLYCAIWLLDRLVVEDGYASQSPWSWGTSHPWHLVRHYLWTIFLWSGVYVWFPVLWFHLWWCFALRDGLQLVDWKPTWIAGSIIGLLMVAASIMLSFVALWPWWH